MAEYYGYAERGANSYVDWAKIGQNLTETVETAYALRDKRKAELDDLMQKNYAELANSPTGQNQDINSAIIQHADNSKQYLLQVNKLLKQGIMKPKEYTLINQNLSEDTKSLFANAKNWQDAYGKILEGVKNNTLCKGMLDISSDIASFGKFKNMQFMINPTTGRLSAAEMITGPNGEQIKGDSKSMQQINVLMNQPIDKYQLTDKLANSEKVLGDFVSDSLVRGAIQKQGSITKVTDKAIKDTFEAAKNTFVNEVMANNFNVLSILTDYAGVIPGTSTPYRVSTKESDRGNPDVIMYIDPDGDGSYTPEFTDEQRKAAEQYVTDQFVGMIDRKVEKDVVNPISPTPEYMLNRGDAEKQKQAAVGAWDMLRWGDAKQKQDAAETLLGTSMAKEEGLVDIDMTSQPGSVVLKYDDSKKNRIIPITADGARWSSIGVELHGENDVNKARKAAGGTWAKPINKDFSGVRAFREGKPVEVATQDTTIPKDAFITDIVGDDTETTAVNLKAKLPDGYDVEQGDYTDVIRIVKRNAKGDAESYSEWFPINNAEEKIVASEGISAYLNDKIKSQPSGALPQTSGAAQSGGNAR